MKQIYTLLFIFIAYSSGAQSHLNEEPQKQFSMFYGNDFTAQTDMYYTNGISFEYMHPALSKSPFNINFLKESKTLDGYHSARLIYHVFTPDFHKELLTDRPFSAYVMLGSKHQYVNSNSELRITSELQIGVIGQAAGAGIFQNGLHKLMPGADRVIGWETQIKNDVSINYVFQLEKQFFRNNFSELIGGTTLYLGTPYTKAEVGTLLRIGLIEDHFNRLNIGPKKNWQLFVFGEVKGSYVLHNATIQGGFLNSFNTYIRNDLSPFVMDTQLGIGAVYKKYGLNLGQHFLTSEFDAGDSHSWGYFSFYINFQ